MPLPQAFLAGAADRQVRAELLTETERIARLPRHTLSQLAEAAPPGKTGHIPAVWAESQALVKKWTERFRRSPSARPLYPIQAALLECAHRQLPIPGAGLLAQAGVGRGKTLVFALLPAVMGSVNPLLFVPSDMLDDTEAARWEWAQEYHIPQCRVVGYGQLSTAKATSLLQDLQPDLILADEVHALKNVTAARTRRVVWYLNHNPECRLIGMSGSLMSRSLRDFAGLSIIALRERTPLPRQDDELEAWCNVMDPNGEPSDANLALVAQLEDGVEHEREALRSALNRRLGSAPGFLLTEESACGAPLLLKGVSPPLSEAVKEALEGLESNATLPDGTPLVEAIEMARARKQLALGFYYQWDWPDGEVDVEWMEARSTWAKTCDDYLKTHARPFFDSRFLVEARLREGKISSDILSNALAAWDLQRHKPPPPTVPVWLDYQPVSWALQRAYANGPALVWFRSRAVGELLQAFGLPAYWHGRPSPDHKVVALSTKVYYKGKDFLTPWNYQLVLQPGSCPLEWEQLLGRTHRGDKEKEVTTEIYQHTEALCRAMATAVRDASAVQSVLGQRQKLLIARYVGLPFL